MRLLHVIYFEVAKLFCVLPAKHFKFVLLILLLYYITYASFIKHFILNTWSYYNQLYLRLNK